MAEPILPGDPEEVRLLDPDGHFIARLAADRQALDALAAGLWTSAPDDRRRRLAALEVLAHRLAGAAGTFGYPEIGEAALVLDDDLADMREGRRAPAPGRIEDAMARLAAALRTPKARL